MLGQAWRQYKVHAALFTSIIFIPLVVSLLVSLVQEGWGAVVPGSAVFILSIVSAIVSLLGQIALFTAVSDPSQATFASSYSAGMKRFFPYLWLMIISVITLLGLTMLFVIPGILFSVWFAMGMFVFIVEDERGMNALLKSKAYVAGHWWGVLWRLIFVGLFIGILTLVISGILGGLFAMAGLTPAMLLISIAVVAGLLSLVFTPLSYVYVFDLYQALKGSKGAIEINRTGAHKAKFIIPALIGLAIIPFFIGSLIFYAKSQGVTIPGANMFNELLQQYPIDVTPRNVIPRDYGTGAEVPADSPIQSGIMQPPAPAQ